MTDHPTGRELLDQLWAAARAKGLPLTQFLAPLSSQPGKYVQQLKSARRPKPHTIERIGALIEGREIPPAPPNNFQATSANREGEDNRAAAAIAAKRELERRRQLAELAVCRRLPGETLHSAVRRLEQQLPA